MSDYLLLSKVRDLYILGYNTTFGPALEGALKFKEITYSHAEGMLSSEFKHGPLSIVQKGYPVIFVVAPWDAEYLVSHINEVSCRDGTVIVVSEPNPILEQEADFFLAVPPSPKELQRYTFPLLSTIPLQLVSYHSSVMLGNDPDRPRNLSKTLTVD